MAVVAAPPPPPPPPPPLPPPPDLLTSELIQQPLKNPQRCRCGFWVQLKQIKLCYEHDAYDRFRSDVFYADELISALLQQAHRPQ